MTKGYAMNRTGVATACRVGWLACALAAGLLSSAAAEGDAGAAAEETTATHGIRVGVDLYTAVGQLPGGVRRGYFDGMWAGNGAQYPSTAYARWDNGSGSAARVSLGFGGMYTNAENSLYQPVEAWWQVPAGSASLTIGKFYVPFGVQEWQYETKPGVMFGWAPGPYEVAASANYNENTRRPNAYLRVGRSFGEAVSIGASLAAGRGLSYDSLHSRAWGVDATLAHAGWRLTSEYMDCRHDAGNFRFGFAKLAYEDLGAWTPFVAAYSWKDRAEEFPNFRSAVAGLGYQVSPALSLEGAYAATSDKGAWWAQAHWAWER